MFASRNDQVRAFVNFILAGENDLKTFELDNATPDLKNETTVWGQIAYSLYGKNVQRMRKKLYTAWNRKSEIPIRKEVLEIVEKEMQSKQTFLRHLHQTNSNKTKVTATDDDDQEVIITNVNTEETPLASPLSVDVVLDTSVLTHYGDNCSFFCSTPKNKETCNIPSIDFSIIAKPAAANLCINQSLQDEVFQSVSQVSLAVAVKEDYNQFRCQSVLMSSVSTKCQEMKFPDRERTYVVDKSGTHNGAVKKFDLSLTVAECNLVFLKGQAFNGMRTGWTEILFDKFSEVWPYCALTFSYHHFRKNSSRKKQSPFWLAKARCRTNACIKVDMRINNEPVNEENVIVQVTIIGTCTHLGKGNSLELQSVLPNRRFLSGNKRRAAADLCIKTRTKARVYCNEKLSKMKSTEVIAGHKTKCQIPQILCQAIYEQNKKSNLHENVVTELFLMMTTWQAALGTSIFGFIQGLGYIPFYVNFYLQQQVEIYIKACRSHEGCILHCDSTGSVVKDQVCEDSMVKARTFLYCFLINDTNIPAFSFLSNRHDADWISGQINIFMKHVRQCASTTVKPRYVVVDFSFAFIYSTLMAWNREDLLTYLWFCYKVLTCKEASDTIMSHTYVCLCAAHMLKAVSMRLSRKEGNAKKRKVVMIYFAMLQRCPTLQVAKNLFSSIQVVLCTEKNLEHVKQAKAAIMNVLNATPMIHDEVETAMGEEAESEGDSEYNEPFPDFVVTHGKLKASSPFTRYFEDCKMQECKKSDDLQIEELNHSHSPSGFSIIKSLTYIFPLWNSALQYDIEKFSNNCKTSHTAAEIQRCRTNGQIESHFRFIKQDLLGGISRLRPSIFLNKYLTDIRGRINEAMMPCIGRNKKRKREMLSVEEKWKSKRQKKSKYTDRKNAFNRLKKIEKTVDRAEFSTFSEIMVLNKGKQSIIEPVTCEGLVKKSRVDDMSKQDEFLHDLQDSTALSLIKKWNMGKQSFTQPVTSKGIVHKSAVDDISKRDDFLPDLEDNMELSLIYTLNKATQSFTKPVTSKSIVHKSAVDDISKRDDFLPDLEDNMELSLIYTLNKATQSFTKPVTSKSIFNKSEVDNLSKADDFLPDLHDNMPLSMIHKLKKGTQSITKPVKSLGIVKKSAVEDLWKRDEFLPDLRDNMALSLIKKSFAGDHNDDKELDSDDMNLALINLRQKFPKVHGLQPVDFGFSCKGKSLPQFDPEPSTFVQVLNIGDHWVCVTNNFSKKLNHVYVYDSFYYKPNEELIVQLTSLLRTLIEPDSITINMRPFCKQKTGSRTCGYYALGAALFLCNGLDPSGLEFNIETLISHVKLLINEKQTTIIPATRIENNQSSVTKHKKLHCLCHGKSTPELMICCSICSNWFHDQCVHVDSYVKHSVDITWNGPCCIGYSNKQRELKKKRLEKKLKC